ncbi:hypothetical protein [Methylophilus sp. DW102]|uniref:hypothetical protein n=1 Tax=Methylophilus sp. DW102 TaxID=3095607 RepID=UPI0030859C38|nr:hypothetical protein MTDW_06660 [Methylophilus sp. DW102]
MASKPNNKPLIQNKPATTPAKPAATAKAPVANKTAAKPVAPVATKPAAKPVLKTAAAPKKASGTPAIKVVNKVATAPEKDKADKDKPKTNKVKMERDSFTMPKEEYAQIATLKKRLEALDKPVKKSELLRAGLKLLSAMDDAALKATLASIPVIKTGRPKK